jgi:RND family efflux transporter MFP subunit
MNKSDTSSKSYLLPGVAIVALLLMVAWMAGMFSNQLAPGQASQEVLENKELLKQDAYEVRLIKQALTESVPGSIEAKHNSIISARILAKIEDVHVRAGEHVKKGQLLIELEQADLQSRVSQAQAALASVSARLVEAAQGLQRSSELNKKGILADALLEQSQANFNSLTAEKLSAEQALVEAQTALAYARVLSPIDGFIIDRFAEPGNTAQPGMQLLTLYNPDTLRVEAHVRETLAIGLQLGDALQVVIPSLNKQLTAVIEEMVPVGNTGSRTFLVKARLEGKNLLPGMYAQLRVAAGSKQGILIPADRVAELGQLNVVWLIEEEQIVRRFIRLGDLQKEGMVEVISGLSVGDRILPDQSQKQ